MATSCGETADGWGEILQNPHWMSPQPQSLQGTFHLPICALTSFRLSTCCVISFLAPSPQPFFLFHPSYYVFVRDFPTWSQRFLRPPELSEASGPPAWSATLPGTRCLFQDIQDLPGSLDPTHLGWTFWASRASRPSSTVARFLGEAFASGPQRQAGKGQAGTMAFRVSLRRPKTAATKSGGGALGRYSKAEMAEGSSLSRPIAAKITSPRRVVNTHPWLFSEWNPGKLQGDKASFSEQS